MKMSKQRFNDLFHFLAIIGFMGIGMMAGANTAVDYNPSFAFWFGFIFAIPLAVASFYVVLIREREGQ